ncbi:hypothetical protein GUJ93_ZPchr0014g47074 [Zizania palustris]|uniref:Uncharacterized protein n=1 Tax=Zizania palustris TaxID=103762 RepID=A0A8J5W5Z4_ZIZPA|nr:hypothetical protein GUJ93_ZPchr0014g47074 [Zizania palustris]
MNARERAAEFTKKSNKSVVLAVKHLCTWRRPDPEMTKHAAADNLAAALARVGVVLHCTPTRAPARRGRWRPRAGGAEGEPREDGRAEEDEPRGTIQRRAFAGGTRAPTTPAARAPPRPTATRPAAVAASWDEHEHGDALADDVSAAAAWKSVPWWWRLGFRDHPPRRRRQAPWISRG